MTQRVIRRVTTKIEEEILADDGQGHPGQLEARLGGDGGHGKDDDGDVAVTRRGARAGRANLALPPISRTRARTGRASDVEEDGEPAQAHLEDDGGHAEDGGDVVEAARGSRAGRTKPAQPPIARPRARNDR
jgi:hypothetical protein